LHAGDGCRKLLPLSTSTASAVDAPLVPEETESVSGNIQQILAHSNKRSADIEKRKRQDVFALSNSWAFIPKVPALFEDDEGGNNVSTMVGKTTAGPNLNCEY
jgi:hypothetical protein